jgi:hypothetical protein
MNKYLVDSTIWIDFFRGNKNTVNDFISSLIDEDKIFYNGIILSELLIGASSPKEFSFLDTNFKGFKYLETDENIFTQAGQMGFKLKRKGLTIPLTDLIIASHGLHHHLTIVTSDPHFALIAKKIKLSLEFINI